MQCSDELINALESLLRLMCNGVEANEALKLILANVKDEQCRIVISNTVDKGLRGEVNELSGSLLNNYLLYLKPKVSDELKGILPIILNMIIDGKIIEALSYLMGNVCSLPDYDKAYVIDLARLMVLAKHDKGIIDSIKCRINLILNVSRT